MEGEGKMEERVGNGRRRERKARGKGKNERIRNGADGKVKLE